MPAPSNRTASPDRPRSQRQQDSQRPLRAVPRLKVSFGPPDHAALGTDPVVWDSASAVNGHMSICGQSGAGKTHQVMRIVSALAEQGAKQVLMIDPHGDMVPAVDHDTIRFSESTPFGLNPLRILADPDIGGVRKRTSAFISMLLRAGRGAGGTGLGPKQLAALRALMTDLYRWRGFDADDPRTWSLDVDPRPGRSSRKSHPDLRDLLRFAESKYRQMRLGGTGRAHSMLQQLERDMQRMQRRGLQRARGEIEADDARLASLKAELKDTFANAIDALETGFEIDDFLRYDSADVIKSIVDRLQVLHGSGIFKGSPPPFDETVAVWRYDLSALSQVEQVLFADCLLEDLFIEAKRRGLAGGPDTFVVIDEAHLFVSDEGDHILNRLIKEGRKFGIGVILSSQSFEHFSTDILTSSAVRLVLGVADLQREAMHRKLGLERVTLKRSGRKASPLEFLRARETALVSVLAARSSMPMTQVRLPA